MSPFEILEISPPLFASANLFTKAAVRKNLTFKPFLHPSTPMAVARCVFPLWKAFHKGKTHLAIRLGRRLCENGYSVRFTQAASLATELSEATEDKVLGRLMKALESVDLLIVDELSYVSFTKGQSELLFHALSARNEKGSVMITTNLEFSKWTELFPDPMLAAAMIDRITHRSHILDMNGASYRLAETKRRQSKGGAQFYMSTGGLLLVSMWLSFIWTFAEPKDFL